MITFSILQDNTIKNNQNNNEKKTQERKKIEKIYISLILYEAVKQIIIIQKNVYSILFV